uniref:RNA methyltransferase n=1 Tax=Globisporangium ultimum (strain ATCC 200006 / CBS 805.95 / DAOM BR144) TaxID=431595 RepID=K3X3X7_GLOUD
MAEQSMQARESQSVRKRHASDRNDNAPTTSASSAACGHPLESTKKRKTQKKLPKQHRVGNFRSYYTFRLGQSRQGELEEDPRLVVLEAQWFTGKRGLDIGCNSGDLTLAIAKRFEPSYLLGVDVDAQLVSRARTNLKEVIQQMRIEEAFKTIPAAQTSGAHGAADTNGAVTEKKTETSISSDGTNEVDPNDEVETQKEKVSEQPPPPTDSNTGATIAAQKPDAFANEMPLSFRLWKPPVQAGESLPRSLGKASTGTTFPLNVVFKREDVVSDTHAGKDYDFITCFSVTKWIHLFHGDDGIKKVFAQVFALLAPGGRFIVEPQPWKSYHKRKFTSEVTATNYQKIQLRPKDFPAFLVDTIGFKKCTFLQVCRTSANGFRRPIYVVEK